MGLFGSFLAKFTRNKATPEDIDEFRKVLIESDIGAEFTDEIIKVVEKEKAEELERKILERILSSLTEAPREIVMHSGRVTTILVVGVNGTGKTTSVAKMAKRYKGEGRKVILAAADTFRAAAVER